MARVLRRHRRGRRGVVGAAVEAVDAVDVPGHRFGTGITNWYGHEVDTHGGTATAGPGVRGPSVKYSKAEVSHRGVAWRSAPEQSPARAFQGHVLMG